MPPLTVSFPNEIEIESDCLFLLLEELLEDVIHVNQLKEKDLVIVAMLQSALEIYLIVTLLTAQIHKYFALPKERE